MNDADFLARVSIFSRMKEEDLDRIAKLTRRHLFQPGDLVIREGERDRRLFIIVKGIVEVLKDMGNESERRIGTLGPYSYFGEMSLVDDLVRSASVVAREETELLSLDQENLCREMERYPSIAIEMLRMLSQRIRAIEKSIFNTLGTFLPICSNCKKIRDTRNEWIPIDKYVSDHSETEFSHGICPGCAKKLYPEYADKLFPEMFKEE